MMAVVLNTTDETVTGRRGLPNDYVAKVVEANSDVLIGFGIVDPWMGRLAIEEVRRCADLGLKGIGEFNPARQHFYPNDPRFYPLWETIQELGLIVLFHTGMAAAGAGTPGGMGIKLKYTRPIPYLDDVAADFPELKIIGAHPSWPYDAENLAVARHKANYFMDLSGWAPKHFSQDLVNHAKSILSDKMLFGSDSGIVSVDRWMEEFNALPIPAASKQKIIRDNAVRLFGLE
jgi:predicted TIM-barrel fold metal-dependent hydrolase